MKESDFRSWLSSERARFIGYVRSLITETASMEAEDIVQDVLVKLLEKSNSTVPLDNAAAYVYRSLRNRVIDKARTARESVSIDEDAVEIRLSDVLADFTPNPLQMLQSEEGKRQLFEALDALSEVERKVVVAHEFEGVSFKELCLQMEIPLNTLLSHKARAIKKLKQKFGR